MEGKEYERRYEQVYNDFNQQHWASVVQTADIVIPQCTALELQAKYAYLRAIAAGQIYNQDTLIQNLTSIVSRYSNTKVADLARIYLSTFSVNRIAQSFPQDTVSSTRQSLQNITGTSSEETHNFFIFNPDEMHYVILLVKSANLPILTVKTNISNFNKTYFSLQHFNVSSFYINHTQQMITISKFNNSETAMDYYYIMTKNENFSGDIANGNIQLYAISATNYTSYYNNKEGRNYYDDFYDQYYLNPKNKQ